MAADLATALPEELFEHVLWHMVGGHVFTQLDSSEARHPIATCGCVCRYWANICRPRLFQFLSLRSRRDLEEYSAMLDAPSPRDLMPLCYLTVRLTAKPDGSEEPWLHLIPSAVLDKLPQRMYGIPVFSVDASILRTSVTLRLNTLHPAIPRTLPSTFSPVTSLELSAVHFADGAELVKLVNGLVHLRSLNLDELSWDTAPEPAAFVSLRAPILNLVIVTGESISPLWFLPALLAKYGRQHNARRIRTAEALFGDGEYETLLKMLHTSRLNTPRDPSVPVVRDILREATEEDGRVHVTLASNQGRRRFIPTISIDFTPHRSLLSSTPPVPDPQTTMILWVKSIWFFWTDSSMPKQWTEGELGEFSQRARELAHLQLLGHRFEAHAYAVEFAEAYADELVPVGNTKCLYRVSDGEYVEHPLTKGSSSRVLMHASVDFTRFQ